MGRASVQYPTHWREVVTEERWVRPRRPTEERRSRGKGGGSATNVAHCWVVRNFSRLWAKRASCCARSSSSVKPEDSSLETFFSRSFVCTSGGASSCAELRQRTFCCCLWSFNTLSTSAVNDSKPSRYIPQVYQYAVQRHRI